MYRHLTVRCPGALLRGARANPPVPMGKRQVVNRFNPDIAVEPPRQKWHQEKVTKCWVREGRAI